MGKHGAVPRSAHSDAYRLFRAMLTELRHKKGVSQAALACLLGVPQSYVSKYELGERRVDLVEAFDICRALDTDPVAFVRRLIKTIESEGARSIASPRNSPHSRR
jgi:transcriptional regulator with XRE-family HTH domain